MANAYWHNSTMYRWRGRNIVFGRAFLFVCYQDIRKQVQSFNCQKRLAIGYDSVYLTCSKKLSVS